MIVDIILYYLLAGLVFLVLYIIAAWDTCKRDIEKMPSKLFFIAVVVTIVIVYPRILIDIVKRGSLHTT